MAPLTIQGRELTLPVRIREAAIFGATYAVRSEAAKAVIAYSGLDIAEALPGKAFCTLLFVDYTDGDLDSYHEFGVAFLVRPPGSAGPGTLPELRQAGLFVHWLPVDQTFTMEAGRTLWGFPKELAEIDLRLRTPYKRCIVRKDGRLVVDLLVRPGMPVPGSPTVSMTAYTSRDGVTRSVPWSMSVHSLRARPGGAMIRLGNHPVAKELSELGLPKRPLLTMTFRGSMSIGPAAIV